jgi:signal transduction histidine kinase
MRVACGIASAIRRISRFVCVLIFHLGASFRLTVLIVCSIACSAPAQALASEPRAKSILLLNESRFRAPLYEQIFSKLRASLNENPLDPVTVYAESLDFDRFGGPAYEQSLSRHLGAKYHDKSIGVVVAIGATTLDYVLRFRATLWPGVPVVFSMVDEATFARLNPPPDVTGTLVKLRPEDTVFAARRVVPNLKRLVLLGESSERQTIFRAFKERLAQAATGLEVIDLSGLPMRSLQERVAALPARSAILYTNIYSSGDGSYYTPSDALAVVAEKATAPIIVANEALVGRGGIGGFVLKADAIGKSVADLAIRILDGEPAASITPIVGDDTLPVFDWRQMQRWKVSEASLPRDSEIRFREATAWDRYRWQIVAVAGIILFQTILIVGIFHEHRRRLNAEIETRQRVSELAYMNRVATAGHLSASIAHEINQPLGAILANAEAGEALLESSSLKFEEIKEILADIKRDDLRATGVIKGLRSLLKKTPFNPERINLGETVREVFDFVSTEASERNVALTSPAMPFQALRIIGDRVQIQQVILNLLLNSMEAVTEAAVKLPKIVGRIVRVQDAVEISISDNGPGIAPDRIAKIFDPFVTTKDHGMGIGLSIARTIVEAHGGRIWAARAAGGGAVFFLTLPLADDKGEN